MRRVGCILQRVVENMEWLVHVYNAQYNNCNALYKVTTRRNLREYVQNGLS